MVVARGCIFAFCGCFLNFATFIPQNFEYLILRDFWCLEALARARVRAGGVCERHSGLHVMSRRVFIKGSWEQLPMESENHFHALKVALCFVLGFAAIAFLPESLSLERQDGVSLDLPPAVLTLIVH